MSGRSYASSSVRSRRAATIFLRRARALSGMGRARLKVEWGQNKFNDCGASRLPHPSVCGDTPNRVPQHGDQNLMKLPRVATTPRGRRPS
jgi:hypothetical protein